MRSRLNTILILFVFTSCALKQEIKLETKNEENLPIYTSPIDFIAKNISSLKVSYLDYFKFAEISDSIKFNIVHSQEIEFNNNKIYGVTLSGIADKNWSYAEKIIIFSSNGTLLADSDFKQIDNELKIPECGVPNITIDSLSVISLSHNKLLTASITYSYYVCCGQSTELKRYLSIFTDSNKVETLEMYYLNESDDACNQSSGREERIAKLFIKEDLLEIKRTEYLEGSLVNSQIQKFRYDGTKLLSIK